jgi:hypothetical protein
MDLMSHSLIGISKEESLDALTVKTRQYKPPKLFVWHRTRETCGRLCAPYLCAVFGASCFPTTELWLHSLVGNWFSLTPLDHVPHDNRRRGAVHALVSGCASSRRRFGQSLWLPPRLRLVSGYNAQWDAWNARLS